jgi:predicted MFS family arabinose efflux permease
LNHGQAQRVKRTCTPAPNVPDRPELRSTRIVFFIAGVTVAAWAPQVPFAKSHAGLGDGALGLLLLCLGAGSIVAMPLAGALASRCGCRRVVVGSTVLICVALPLLTRLSSVATLAAALFTFGAGLGSLDCVMNIQAVIVERTSRRPMMSGFHGLFSVGGIVGAGGVSGLLSIGASPLVTMLCVSAGIVAALIGAARHLLPSGGKPEGPSFAMPHGIVLFIGILCFIMFLTEGAVLDWSAIFLTSVRGAMPSYGGLGYAAFAVTMTAGRLAGDAIVRRLGGALVVIIGSFCAAAGLFLAALCPTWAAGILGFALVGAGCSNIVPILYTAVGRQKIMPEHTAIPAITTLGYAGILVSPAAIGFIAHTTSLSTAFLAVGLLLVAVAASWRALRV